MIFKHDAKYSINLMKHSLKRNHSMHAKRYAKLKLRSWQTTKIIFRKRRFVTVLILFIRYFFLYPSSVWQSARAIQDLTFCKLPLSENPPAIFYHIQNYKNHQTSILFHKIISHQRNESIEKIYTKRPFPESKLGINQTFVRGFDPLGCNFDCTLTQCCHTPCSIRTILILESGIRECA